MKRWVAGLLALPGVLSAAPIGSDDGDLPRLTYHLPEQAAASAEDAYAPPWEEGTTLVVAADGVALREAPSSHGRRLRTLPAGTRVRVIRCDAELRTEAGFVHRWVAVEVEETLERGHVFGGFLTPLGIVADLDGDRRSEVATVAFTPEAQVVVRVYSPGRPEQSVSFRAAGEAYLSHRGGTVKAVLIPASEAGLPLVRVYSGQEACADYSNTFVSFVPATGEAVPRPRIAMETSGLSDPPTMARTEERFDPASRSVTVRTTVSREEDDGRVVEEKVRVKRYQLRDGVYVLVPQP